MSGAVQRFIEQLLAPLKAELEDPEVTEILVNGPLEVFVERGGRLERSGVRFDDSRQLLAALRAIAQTLGRPLSDASPILEGRLPDGSRIEALLPPLVSGGPHLAIRKHQQSRLGIDALISSGFLTPLELAFLRDALERRQNVLVSGGTGSGKTSLLNCLATLIPATERIVTIEDARELQLGQRHVVSLESRRGDERGGGAIGIAELFHATLRLRPDRIVIGELRGTEAFQLVQAMTSGHDGSMSTLHASSPADALKRLEAMAIQHCGLPLPALRSHIASAIDVIVQVERLPDGKRRLCELALVRGMNERGDYELHSGAHPSSEG